MKARLLLVDDHQVVRTAIGSVLATRWGYDICGEAENGLEATQKARDLKPDVVLLDLRMPVMNGTTAAREIRSIAPGIKIVFLSMHDAEMVVELERLTGADAGLSKTCAIEEVHKVIVALLKPTKETPAFS